MRKWGKLSWLKAGSAAGFCEHSNERSDAIKVGKFIVMERAYKRLKKASDLWNYLTFNDPHTKHTVTLMLSLKMLSSNVTKKGFFPDICRQNLSTNTCNIMSVDKLSSHERQRLSPSAILECLKMTKKTKNLVSSTGNDTENRSSAE
jgi:hypothetical protein